MIFFHDNHLIFRDDCCVKLGLEHTNHALVCVIRDLVELTSVLVN